MHPQNKKILIGLSIFVGLVILINTCDSGNKKDDVTSDSMNPKEQLELDLVIAKEKTDYKQVDYKDVYIQYAQGFDDIAIDIRNAYRSGEDSLIDVAREVQKHLPSKQKKAFPILRKMYIEAMKNTLWPYNFKISGTNKTINLIHASFADNMSIKLSMDSLNNELHTLRFDKVRYYWYEGSNWTEYDLHALKDEIIDTTK